MTLDEGPQLTSESTSRNTLGRIHMQDIVICSANPSPPPPKGEKKRALFGRKGQLSLISPVCSSAVA
ncbi:hypothetical protein H112_02401 [Trichophyton rubrum D6]|uniref:Uncharacterized protein n=2 Tax=Trichophyton TaxID=5550 RepID=A0A022W961_TRIRU|nr:hypothetical protein H100_02402 [Trichophyton rubrum MR850]EZF44268.1 hypothetical protein H102_02399 [Trichophyton rubrum CBS 100081]EZF54907.1 hypothetical protein H103_02411 [Trichophyton rubrum CBS 288.86]EZF65540.1 hypothetical protein H104_02386 [Trichophyton rubrum CBS 289.86]EZF76167.1 hypothetical protein H105_02420 [Trichophyton soudanense CBS 452.61]EZF86817.1 hypothetical protein H110_02405 [Trichophyton rubrum MR1448]EZF97608.1 hypothetical protein H113_02415 [Trichophyton rub